MPPGQPPTVTLIPHGTGLRRKNLPRSLSRVAVIFSALILLGSFLLFGFDRLRYDLRSYVLLTRFVMPQPSGLLQRWESHAFTVADVSIPTPDGPVAAHLYLPVGIKHPPGMVIVHGIHHLGFDEPRLVSLARAATANGFAVLTPQVAALADYGVDAASVRTIGLSPGWLEQRLGTGKVTVIAVSFAGGLALLAASDPQYAAHMRELVLMGAYDDLEHVSQFLVTGQAELPDGSFTPLPAHEYGGLVFIYAHLDQFFPAVDLPVAREALRYYLWEEPQQARPLLARLSPGARATMEMLFSHQVSRLRPQLLAVLNADQPRLAALSPRGHLGNLEIPVYILHGAGDDIIPYTESLWLEHEVPQRELRAALITNAFSHVDPQKDAGWLDKVKLVDFLGKVLHTAAGP